MSLQIAIEEHAVTVLPIAEGFLVAAPINGLSRRKLVAKRVQYAGPVPATIKTKPPSVVKVAAFSGVQDKQNAPRLSSPCHLGLLRRVVVRT